MKGILRKVRKVGSSLVITIPAQLAQFYQIEDGVRFYKNKIVITRTRREI